MAAKLAFLETLPDVDDGIFLHEAVRSIYHRTAITRSATAPIDVWRPLDHQHTSNYNDVDEFFWSAQCLKCDKMKVTRLLVVHDAKTLKEQRSVINSVLAFLRVWFSLFVAFYVMAVITFVAYMAEEDDGGGHGFIFRIFSRCSKSDSSTHILHAACDYHWTFGNESTGEDLALKFATV